MIPGAPLDPELQEVEVGGRVARFTDEGEGPVVVAIHGLPGSVKDFRWLAPALVPEGVRLVRLGLPGFDSDPVTRVPPLTPPRIARFVQEVLEALELDEVVVLGHSFGGVAATATASLHPERVRGLALLASIGPRRHRGAKLLWPQALALALALRIPGIRGPLTRKVQETLAGLGFPDGYRPEVLRAMMDTSSGVSFEGHAARLAALRVPTFVAWAEDDRLIETEISEALYWACPAGPRVSFEDGGHNIQKTRAVELGAALGAWIRQLHA